MKKILVVSMVAVFALSCAGGKKQHENCEAKAACCENKPAYVGTFKGVTPCADCDGIGVELTLNGDNTYVKKTLYQGKSGEVYEEKGSYAWNEQNEVITLENVTDGPNKYLVKEGQLVQLDMEGNLIDGEFAAMYILNKQ